MQRLLLFAAAVALLFAAATSARADEQADMKALIEKAIKAHGGGDNIDKLKAATQQIKGKFYGLGDGIDYTGTISFQSPDKLRVEINSEFMGQKFKSTQIINKDKGWYALNDNVNELDKEGVEEAKEGMHVNAVARLMPAILKDAKLASLGEVKVGDKPAVGVRVEVKGRRDVCLFFDKETNMLVKSETRAKDVLQGGGEFTGETLYSDYKKVGGMMLPHKITMKRDGKLFVESEVTEFKQVEKIDEAQFAKP